MSGKYAHQIQRLVAAIKEGDLEKVKKSIGGSRYLDVGIDGSTGMTPLQAAASYNQYDIAEFLISKGADVNGNMHSGWAPFHSATTPEMMDMKNSGDINVKHKDNGLTPLHSAAQSGHCDVLRLLISKGADINAKDKTHSTALHTGFYRHDVVNLLITLGANVKIENIDDKTPLHLAAEGGHRDIVELLINNGANVDMRKINYDLPNYRTMDDDIMALLMKHANDHGYY